LCPETLWAGVDEVGRGCLFGPVFAAAVLLDGACAERLAALGVTDSKQLTSRRRQGLLPSIVTAVPGWGLGQSSAREIDAYGIRAATELAMVRALQRLPQTPPIVRVDGVLPLRLWAGPQTCLVRGDQQDVAIASASIVAKQARDALMERLDRRWPVYGLAAHKGYGTERHRRALEDHGPCPLHRRGFLRSWLPEGGHTTGLRTTDGSRGPAAGPHGL
jgi:ribonuclease HII